MRFSKLSYKKLYKIFKSTKAGKLYYDIYTNINKYFDRNKLKNYTGEILPDILINNMYIKNKYN